METRLKQFRALTFDCYGTLIDWEAGILAALRPWLARFDPHLGDEAVLTAFSKTETVVEKAMPGALYPDVLRHVHAAMANEFGVPSSAADADALAYSVGNWMPFPDTCAALMALKRRYKLVIVSNVDRASFARTNQKLGVEFDAIITAEDVGSYKPAMGHFNRAKAVLSEWRIGPGEWLHVAESLYHDHVPAKSMGLSTVWVHRRHGRDGFGATPEPSTAIRPDWTVTSLGEFGRLVEAD